MIDVCLPAANRINIYISMVLNFTTDLYLFLIPIPMLWAAQLPKAKRIGLIVLFSGGIVIMIAGILRCTSILKVCLCSSFSHSRNEQYN